jgi:GTPase SAR1 family protein
LPSFLLALCQNPSQTPNSLRFENAKLDISGQNEEKIRFRIWNASIDDDSLRKSMYTDTDLFLLCYAIDNLQSYDNIVKWVAEISETLPPHGAEYQMLVVGLKTDVRYKLYNNNPETKSYSDGVNLAMSINSIGYIEWSTFESIGYARSVFQQYGVRKTKAILTKDPLHVANFQINVGKPKTSKQTKNARNLLE